MTTIPPSSAPPSQPAAERPGVLLQIGGQSIAVHSDAASDWPLSLLVEQVHARVRCTACAAHTTLVAVPTFVCRDDDHFAYFDDHFESRHTGTCVGCGSDLHLTVTYCITSQILTPKVQAELGMQSGIRGCVLASPPAC